MAGAEHFDFVIVGGGSAGCVLASRLSADTAARVLLLEAGGRDWHPLIRIPIGVGMMWARRMFDWGYDSEPEPNLNNRRIEMMRGRVLGGCSSINAMAHVRGHPGDFDRWAAGGCPGWSYRDVLPYFRRAESWQGGADELRGESGPIRVVYTTTRDPLFDAWIAAAQAAGIPFGRDYNGPNPEGVARSQYALDSGRRCSAARGYLHPVMGRKNLVVRTRAMAERLILEGGQARGVAYRHRGQVRRALADSQVILSGGAFNTPKLLMQSGIGPAEHLAEHGIACVLDRPQLGGNLQDHLGAEIPYVRRGNSAFHANLRFDRAAVNMPRAWLFGSGPATVLPSGLHGFVRTRDGLDAPDIQFIFRGAPRSARLWFPGLRPAYRDGYGVRPLLLHPRSRGRVRLSGPRADDPVRIFGNFLSEPGDLEVLRDGVRMARALANSAAMDAFRESEQGPDGDSDAEIDAWIRAKAATAHHPCGTCRMGADDEAIVDPSLRLNGIERLRVADASVMPDVVSGNIHATVLMIAEKCSDMVAGDA